MEANKQGKVINDEDSNEYLSKEEMENMNNGDSEGEGETYANLVAEIKKMEEEERQRKKKLEELKKAARQNTYETERRQEFYKKRSNFVFLCEANENEQLEMDRYSGYFFTMFKNMNKEKFKLNQDEAKPEEELKIRNTVLGDIVFVKTNVKLVFKPLNGLVKEAVRGDKIYKGFSWIQLREKDFWDDYIALKKIKK